MAETITRLGRELLDRSVKIVENELRMKVIYGDTDSIIVDTGSKEKNGVEIGR